jgi:hypothetical protein
MLRERFGRELAIAAVTIDADAEREMTTNVDGLQKISKHTSQRNNARPLCGRDARRPWPCALRRAMRS